MGMYTKPILDLITRKPGIRIIEIADLVDCDPDMVESSIRDEIKSGVVIATPITAPNGKSANALRMRDAVLQKQTETMQLDDKDSFRRMTVSEWYLVPNNPRQRDTKRHAATAQKHHLRAAADVHKYVVAAMLPSGELVKLDGHTRSFLWRSGKLPPPKCVIATIRAAADMQEAMAMYMEYDNKRATETTRDKTTGALNQTGTQFKNKLMKGLMFVSALTLAKTGAIDTKTTEGEGIYRLVEEYRGDLLTIDALNPRPDRFVVGILAAAIITFRKHGKEALTFWDLYNQDMGEKAGKEKCAVEALTDLIRERRMQKALASRHNAVDVCGRAIAACEKWLKGEKYSGGIKGVDVALYLKQKIDQ
jgi:hypothetical protein